MKDSRRAFLKKGILAGLPLACGAGAIVSFLQSCTAARNITSTVNDGVLTLDKATVGAEKMVIVHAQGLRAPVCLSGTTGNYTASLMLCTHKECELNAAGGFLVCPCHGSEFSGEGKVLKDPAERDLLHYPVKEDELRIYIQIT